MVYPNNYIDDLKKRVREVSTEIFVGLSQVDQTKGRWTGAVGLSPQYMNRLKRSALITSAGASTRIEGSRLDDEEVRELVEGVKITRLRDRDEEEVKGYYEAANFINENYENIRLTENHIKELHQILLKYSTKDVRHREEYKHMSNDVVARDANGREVGVVFRTMSPLETPMAMEGLLKWLNEEIEEGVVHPLIITAGFVVEFLRIHPFIDGNGRMSRLLTSLLMLKFGFRYVMYASLEKIIEENKADYYIALRQSQETFGGENENIESWLRFFVKVCGEQAKLAEDLINGEDVEAVLSRAQSKVYDAALELDEFSIGELEERTDVPRATIRQAVDKLKRMGLVKPRGEGRGTRYKINQS